MKHLEASYGPSSALYADMPAYIHSYNDEQGKKKVKLMFTKPKKGKPTKYHWRHAQSPSGASNYGHYARLQHVFRWFERGHDCPCLPSTNAHQRPRCHQTTPLLPLLPPLIPATHPHRHDGQSVQKDVECSLLLLKPTSTDAGTAVLHAPFPSSVLPRSYPPFLFITFFPLPRPSSIHSLVCFFPARPLCLSLLSLPLFPSCLHTQARRWQWACWTCSSPKWTRNRTRDSPTSRPH